MSDERVTSAEVPDGAVVTGELGIVFFMDEDGTERFATVLGVDALTSVIVGQIEMVKHAFLVQGTEHDDGEE